MRVKFLDLSAVLADKPDGRLIAGQVSTIVEVLVPEVCEVGSCDSKGRTNGFAELKRQGVLVWRPLVRDALDFH